MRQLKKYGNIFQSLSTLLNGIMHLKTGIRHVQKTIYVTGGKFIYRMEAKDGSFGFDFGGVYDTVTEHKFIEYTIGDGRKVKVTFDSNGNTTHVTENFEAENTHSPEIQKGGWQNILDSFKKYTEAN